MKKFIIGAIVTALVLTAGISAAAETDAPICENMEFSTYKNISFGGQLKAHSQENEPLVFELTTEPIKGSIRLEQDGSFVYTPNEGKKGKDYFGYKAIDSQGRSSQEGTVIIRIEKQKKSFEYSDMRGRGEEYAAVLLNELNLFTGEKLGGQYCFYPEREVSRGEFLTMCMQLCGEDRISSVISTGYTDDADIPQWLKPYVLTAAMSGVDNGLTSEDGTVFAPQQPISPAEAATMLNRAMDFTDVTYLNLNSDLSAEAAQACANLSACGIIREGEIIKETLTRAEAATILINAWQLRLKEAEANRF